MKSVTLEEGNIKGFEGLVKPEMEKVLRHFEKDILSIRTGRAHTSLVEDLKAECYGNMMPLRELASIATPATNMITIQPWDKTVVPAIEKALLASHLGITPQTDGDLIRIELPKMSSDRRGELVKTLSKKTEDGRVGIRSVRKDFVNVVRDNEKNKTISEDFSKRLSKVLQDVTDKFIATIEETSKKKEKEITTI